MFAFVYFFWIFIYFYSVCSYLFQHPVHYYLTVICYCCFLCQTEFTCCCFLNISLFIPVNQSLMFMFTLLHFLPLFYFCTCPQIPCVCRSATDRGRSCRSAIKRHLTNPDFRLQMILFILVSPTQLQLED